MIEVKSDLFLLTQIYPLFMCEISVLCAILPYKVFLDGQLSPQIRGQKYSKVFIAINFIQTLVTVKWNDFGHKSET